ERCPAAFCLRGLARAAGGRNADRLLASIPPADEAAVTERSDTHGATAGYETIGIGATRGSGVERVSGMALVGCSECRHYFVTAPTAEQEPLACPHCHGPTRSVGIAEAAPQLRAPGTRPAGTPATASDAFPRWARFSKQEADNGHRRG